MIPQARLSDNTQPQPTFFILHLNTQTNAHHKWT